MAETKPKEASSLRQPKAKKSLGLTVRPLPMPHDSLIKSEESTLPSQTSPTSHTSAAPVRDYHKVPNSVTRVAVPAGLFTGKSKQLYDCLYAMTRGAIVPTRTVRISRPKLMDKAHIGARVTFEANVARLISVGLLSVRQIAGEHEGNEYTVYTPDEVSMPSQSSRGSHTTQTSPAQNLDGLASLESSQTRHSLNEVVKEHTDEPKTSSKTTTTDDDEPMPLLRARVRKPMPQTEAILLSPRATP